MSKFAEQLSNDIAIRAAQKLVALNNQGTEKNAGFFANHPVLKDIAQGTAIGALSTLGGNLLGTGLGSVVNSFLPEDSTFPELGGYIGRMVGGILPVAMHTPGTSFTNSAATLLGGLGMGRILNNLDGTTLKITKPELFEDETWDDLPEDETEKQAALNIPPGLKFNPKSLLYPGAGALAGLGWGLYDSDDTSTIIGKTLGGASVGLSLLPLQSLYQQAKSMLKARDTLKGAVNMANDMKNRGFGPSQFETDSIKRSAKYFNRLMQDLKLNDIAVGTNYALGLPLSAGIGLGGSLLRKDYDFNGNYIPVEDRV